MELPVAFCDEMKRILGDEYEDYLKSMEGTRKFGLRVNTAKISVEDFLKISPFELTPIPYVKNGFYYDGEKEQPAKHPYYFAGLYYLQDPSAMTPASRLPIEENDVVLDLCAAPGGKALHAAQILNGTGMVEARDLTEMKVELIRENISRMGFENIRAVQQDATCFDADSEEKADVLIADLPCSGLGVLAKKTDLKYKMNSETETEVAPLQREILDAVCRYVKPEGTLMYSTCTISRTENEENAGWFAEKHPEFDLEWEKQIFPSDITDGFYIAKFIRRGRLWKKKISLRIHLKSYRMKCWRLEKKDSAVDRFIPGSMKSWWMILKK